jgi:hypothetical protein
MGLRHRLDILGHKICLSSPKCLPYLGSDYYYYYYYGDYGGGGGDVILM